jgi:hypothetical protein
MEIYTVIAVVLFLIQAIVLARLIGERDSPVGVVVLLTCLGPLVSIFCVVVGFNMVITRLVTSEWV